MAQSSPTMDDLVSQLREHLIPEIITEIATAEIALWSLAITAIVVVLAAIGSRRRAQYPEAAGAAAGRRLAQLSALTLMFVIWTIQVSRSGWLTHADGPVLTWFTAHRSGTWTTVAVVITDVGSPVGIALITVALAVYTGWRRRSIAAPVLLLAVVGVAAAAGTATKLLMARARPPAAAQLLTETDFSYPSGHVTGTAALVGTVLVIYGAKRTLRWRCGAAGIGVIIVLAVAATRLYLGVHWFTDVAGGAILAAIVVTAAASFLAILRTQAPSHTAAIPHDLQDRPTSRSLRTMSAPLAVDPQGPVPDGD